MWKRMSDEMYALSLADLATDEFTLHNPALTIIDHKSCNDNGNSATE